MQKKIIALAVAGLASTAAFAQTNVTIYGVVDVGQAYVKGSGATQYRNNLGLPTNSTDTQSSVGRLDSNSSYIGFRGVEDLGNGIKALFQYETGFAADTAGALAGGRDTYIGLTGGFGTLVAGNLTHPLRAMGAKVELAPGATGLGTTMSVTGRLLGLKTGADERAANAIAYVSPSFGGFTVTGAYVNGENKVNTNNNSINQRAYQIAGQYDNGPLYVGLGYHRAEDTGLNGAGVYPSAIDRSSNITRAAAAYTFPSATKLTALYDVTNAGLVGGGKAKRNAWSLGVAQGFGKNTIGFEYGQAGDARVGGTKQNDTGAKIATLVYSYEFSKRTMLHARYSRLSNDANTNNNFYINPVRDNGVNSGNGTDYTGFMVGLRHAF